MDIRAVIENIRSRRRGHRRRFRYIGKNVIIKKNVVFEFEENISIGNNVSINEFSVIHGMGGIAIGNDVRIGYGVKILSFNHRFGKRTPVRLQGYDRGKITIGDDVWIGGNAMILKGITIGKGCIIGAGSVVTKATKPYGIYAGIPAKLIGVRGRK